jgi:hypothetical protein
MVVDYEYLIPATGCGCGVAEGTRIGHGTAENDPDVSPGLLRKVPEFRAVQISEIVDSVALILLTS